jgi:ferredoxin
MAFVVTENCQSCRFTHCVSVCPAGCFHRDEQMVYIDPESCIDCGACAPECPVDAIWNEYELPQNLQKWSEINRDKASKAARLEQQIAPLPTAEARRRELGFAK